LEDIFQQVAILRVVLAGGCLLALYAMKWMTVKQSFMVLAMGMIVFNLVIVIIGVLSSDLGEYTYQQGTILVIVYCCTLFQAPVKHSMLIVLGCCITYLVGILGFSSTGFVTVINNTLLFSTAGVLGMMAVYQREKYLKQYFLDSLVLRKQKQVANTRAMTDALTGLPNRYSLMRHLEIFHGRVPRQLLIMMLDVDNFKALNDEFGHAKGDSALKAISQTLKNIVVQEQGFMARYGGEEFIIFLEDVSFTHGQRICDLLVSEVAQEQYEGLPSITISLGAYYSSGEESSVSECIEVADQTLLQVKRDGKNHFKITQEQI
jgi:diguanylate cyclase (GGDEF)-like protein